MLFHHLLLLLCVSSFASSFQVTNPTHPSAFYPYLFSSKDNDKAEPQNALVVALLQFFLTLPVVYLNRTYYKKGIKSLVKGAPNMDSLIAVGSGAALVYGIFALFRVSTESYTIEQRLLGASERIIVTDVFYLPEQMPRLFFEKDVVQVISKEDITLLRQFLKEHKAARFTLLLSPRFRRMDDAVLKKLLTAFPLLSQPERLTGKGGFPDLFRGTCAVPASK